MTKVLILAPKYPPETGGASVYFQQVVELLEESDYQVTVFAPRHAERDYKTEEHGAVIYRAFPSVGARFYAGLKDIGRFHWLLKRVEPDIAHVHPHFPQYRWFRYLLKAHRIPRIYDCRDKDFTRRYVTDGVGYLSATAEIDQLLIDELGVRPSKITRVPVAMPTVACGRQDVNGKNTVGFVGELTEHKGLKQTVHAVACLLSDQDVTLHVAGEGPLRDWIQCLDHDTNWIEYHGEVPHEEAVGLIQSVDVVCAPSIREGRPRVALEAISMGTPVVGTDAGELPDVIGEAGVIVERSTATVARGIETVLRDEFFANEAANRVVADDEEGVLAGLESAYARVAFGQ